MSEDLKDFIADISLAATRAPDEYAEWSSWTYETHMADLRELWERIHPELLKSSPSLAEFVDTNLQEMFEAFDSGETQKGRAAAWAIYNADWPSNVTHPVQ